MQYNMIFRMENYTDSEGDLSKANSDDETTIEPTLTEFQNRYNQLRERYVTLKTMTETLREQISNEKQQLSKELKLTAELDAQLRKRHVCGDRCVDYATYRKKLQLFKDFLRYQKTTENLEDIVKRNNYQHWLSEVEVKCNAELLKIKEHMIVLKPLKDIALKWQSEDQYEKQNLPEFSNRLQKLAVGGASGDMITPAYQVASLPDREVKMATGDS